MYSSVKIFKLLLDWWDSEAIESAVFFFGISDESSSRYIPAPLVWFSISKKTFSDESLDLSDFESIVSSSIDKFFESAKFIELVSESTSSTFSSWDKLISLEWLEYWYKFCYFFQKFQ